MAIDTRLVRTIKANFAAKSLAQLQEIADDDSDETWSPEAIAAANELLKERHAGTAPEPRVPEPPQHIGRIQNDAATVALGLTGMMLGGLLGGYLVVPVFRNSDLELPPDLPQPFGPGLAWLALDTKDTEAVSEAINLRGCRETTWAHGIEQAYKSKVFVTPPLGDWTLIASTSLLPAENVAALQKPLLERLSACFRDAQYFCMQSDLQLHGWARACCGKLIRGHIWFGKEKQTLWDEGALTREERFLNLPVAEPDAGAVKQLSVYWSVDPSTLDQEFKEPLPGLLGSVDWSRDTASR